MKLKHMIYVFIIFYTAMVAVSIPSNVEAENICDEMDLFCVDRFCEIPFDIVKDAILSAYSFFEQLGYYGRYQINIEITPEVFVEWKDGNYIDRHRVIGKYVEEENKIFITCPNENWLTTNDDFLLKIIVDYYGTIISHEMIHFLANRFSNNKVHFILSEYIACCGQLEMIPENIIMELAIKNQIEAFEDYQICELTYIISPHVFCLKSYLHYKNDEGYLINKILNGSCREPSFSNVP
jgi:hypothetical protein